MIGSLFFDGVFSPKNMLPEKSAMKSNWMGFSRPGMDAFFVCIRHCKSLILINFNEQCENAMALLREFVHNLLMMDVLMLFVLSGAAKHAAASKTGRRPNDE
ncbi:MAG: hypothetical protein I4O49_23760 [Janthinobacterium lividum]|nr:hypothetical protein [Janthinobacterium lividum]